MIPGFSTGGGGVSSTDQTSISFGPVRVDSPFNFNSGSNDNAMLAIVAAAVGVVLYLTLKR